MANGVTTETGKQLTELTALTTFNDADLMLVRDISDTTSQIKEKKAKLSDLKTYFIQGISQQQPSTGGPNYGAPIADPTDIILMTGREHHGAAYNFTTGPAPQGWGAVAVSNEPGAVVGSGNLPLPDNIVILSNTRIGYGSVLDKRVVRVTIGTTDYAVPTLRLNGRLGGREIVFSNFTQNLPATGNWQAVVFHFSDGSSYPTIGASKDVVLNKSVLNTWLGVKQSDWDQSDENAPDFIKNKPASGGTLTLGDSQLAVFNIPAMSAVRLTTAVANTPVFHNIDRFTGTGLPAILTPSVVNSVGRITVGQAGYVNIHFSDEVQIISATAGGSGRDGELVFVITHYNSTGTSIREWIWEHAVIDPITASIKVPIDITTGLTPVDVGDYFTCNFAFNAVEANKNINFELTENNPALDERFEFFYFPLASINQNRRNTFTPTQANIYSSVKSILKEGNNITLSPDDSRDEITIAETLVGVTKARIFQDIHQIEDQINATKDEISYDTAAISSSLNVTSATLNFLDYPNSPVIDPDKGYKLTINNYGQHRFKGSDVTGKTAAAAGGAISSGNSFTLMAFNFGDQEQILVHLGITAAKRLLIAFEKSATNTDGTAIGSGNAEVKNFTLTLEQSEFIVDSWAQVGNTDQIPVNKLGNVSGLSGGDIVSRLEALQGNNKLDASALKDLPESHFVAVQTLPTDLSPYVNNEIIKIIVPDEWRRVTGANGGEQHGFKILVATDPLSANNFGYSGEGDIYGTMQTEDGGSLSESQNPILRWEIQRRETQLGSGTYEYSFTLLIKKSSYASPATNVYIRVYQSKPGTTNDELVTMNLTKAADNPLHNYHTYLSADGDGGPSSLWSSRQYIRYFRLFTSNPRTDDETSNPLNFHSAKTTTVVDPRETGLSIKTKLETLSGNDRLSASAVKDIPGQISGDDIKTKLEDLSGNDRLESSAIKDLPDGVENTPRRVTSLSSTPLDGERVYLSADYDKSFFDIIPEEVGNNTEFSGEGIGTRGWVRYRQFGSETHAALSDDFRAITDTRVYVKKDTQTDLRTLKIGTATRNLVRVPQVNEKLPPFDDEQPLVDHYTITGGMPTGDWLNMQFIRADNSTYPNQVVAKSGEYKGQDGAWVKDDFNADLANPSREFKFRIEQIVDGNKSNKSITFNSTGSGANLYYTASNPFDKILSLNFYPSTYGTSTDQQSFRNRWSVVISTVDFVDDDAPSVLEIRNTNYSFAYLETESGNRAVYRTPVVATAQRLTAAGSELVNIQKRDGIWLGQQDQKRLLRTLDKESIQIVANKIKDVHSIPSSPHEGQQIRALNDIVIQGGAVLKAAESEGTSTAAGSQGVSIAGLFTGYERDAEYASSVPGDLGSLTPVNSNILGLLSFSNAHSAGNQANKTILIVPRATYTPSKVFIDGKSYSLTSQGVGFWVLTGLDGSFLKNGHEYYVNVENASGTPLYPNITLQQGKVYEFDGIRWISISPGLDEGAVNAAITAKLDSDVEPIALKKNTVTGQYFKPKGFWYGTQAQLNAITKLDNYVYYVHS